VAEIAEAVVVPRHYAKKKKRLTNAKTPSPVGSPNGQGLKAVLRFQFNAEQAERTSRAQMR